MKRKSDKISKWAMLVGCLVVCLIVAGAVVRASNDSINVNQGGTLNLYNQAKEAVEDFSGNLGAAGGMLAENYISYIMYNGGFNTAKPMTLQDTLDVTGASTFASTLGITGAITASGEIQAQRIVNGGTVYASSTTNALSLTAAQVCDNSVIALTETVSAAAALAITLPATSTLAADCLDTIGDSITFLYRNASTKAASTTVLTTSSATEMDVQSDDANGDIIAGLATAEVKVTRSTRDYFVVTIAPFTPAD